MLRRRSGQAVDERVDGLARRLEDLEDTVAATLGRDLIDDLTFRVEELGLSAVTHDDLLKVRTDVARLAAELTRVRADLQAELDRVAGAIADLTELGYRRAEAG